MCVLLLKIGDHFSSWMFQHIGGNIKFENAFIQKSHLHERHFEIKLEEDE